jgi:hypothetical protein
LPVFVQVEDHGQAAPVVVAEAVEMPLIAGARRIDGEVQFHVEQAQEQALVHRQAQCFQFFQDGLEGRARLAFVDPEHMVAANFRTDLSLSASHAGGWKPPAACGLAGIPPARCR